MDSLCCTPETNKLLYVNYISIKTPKLNDEREEVQIPLAHPKQVLVC